MKTRIKRYRTAGAVLALTCAMSAPVSGAAARTTLGDQEARALFNTAVSYQYHAKVRRKTAQGVCFFDPRNPATLRCSWRTADPGANAHSLGQRARQDAVKWCKRGGGESCVELYRNGKLRYDGLSPEQTQRLEAVLGSIPSYEHEATPLPEGSTIRGGLFHERFAQMQGHWEDWRKKKKGRRNYAICANEQGSGVRFAMQGAAKQMPHVRAMCILQCQAVAQWEDTTGQCHTIFENGEFTSTAAQRAMQLKVEPASPEVHDAFAGAWKGIDHLGTTIETVIERVDSYGRVTGTGCSEYANGSLSWQTLDKAKFVNGDRVTLMNGKVRMTLMMDGAQGVETIRTWPSGWQRRTPMEPMSGRGCNERFTVGAAAEPVAERQEEDAPIMGAWSGRWKNGNLVELAIEAVGQDGALTGRYCTKRRSGALQLWDLGADGPFKGTLGKKGKKARMTIPWGQGNRDEFEFRLKGNDKVTMKHTARAGTNKQKVSTLQMTRGASVGGCLVNTTSRPGADQG